MTQQTLMEIVREIFFISVMLVTPALTAALVVGVLISIFQSITSIQEQTLVLIPKMFAVIATLYFILPWMFNILKQLTIFLIEYTVTVSQH